MMDGSVKKKDAVDVVFHFWSHSTKLIQGQEEAREPYVLIVDPLDENENEEKSEKIELDEFGMRIPPGFANTRNS